MLSFRYVLVTFRRIRAVFYVYEHRNSTAKHLKIRISSAVFWQKFLFVAIFLASFSYPNIWDFIVLFCIVVIVFCCELLLLYSVRVCTYFVYENVRLESPFTLNLIFKLSLQKIQNHSVYWRIPHRKRYEHKNKSVFNRQDDYKL